MHCISFRVLHHKLFLQRTVHTVNCSYYLPFTLYNIVIVCSIRSKLFLHRTWDTVIYRPCVKMPDTFIYWPTQPSRIIISQLSWALVKYSANGEHRVATFSLPIGGNWCQSIHGSGAINEVGKRLSAESNQCNTHCHSRNSHDTVYCLLLPCFDEFIQIQRILTV